MKKWKGHLEYIYQIHMKKYTDSLGFGKNYSRLQANDIAEFYNA